MSLLIVGCGGGSRSIAPITLKPMSTIGATNGPGTLATWPRVSAHHPGGYRVLVPQPGGMTALPIAFADDGTMLGSLGSVGDSAGGFREPLFAKIGPGDSIWVFDNAQRALVFGPDRTWARTVALPIGPWDAAVDDEGRMLVASSSSERPFPLLLIGPAGGVVREFSGDAVSRAIHSPRRLLRAPDGSWWTLPMQFRYRLEHWDSLGNSLGVIERDAAWFPGYQMAASATPTQSPSPMIMNAWFDKAGRLWVLGKAADPNWRDGLGKPGTDGASAIVNADKVYDTVVEVLDPATSALLAETRFDVSYPFAVEPEVIMRVLTSTAGWNRADLMRVVLDTAALKRNNPR